MKIQPVAFVWDGRAMIPDARYGNLCARQYDVGTEYVLEPVATRNMDAHKAYFAVLRKMWLNLPENVSAKFPSSEYLRHWALVQTGYYNERTHVCDNKKLAKQVAAIVRTYDTYAIIQLREDTVVVWDAKSQAVGAMKPDEFTKSSNDVLDLVLSMIPGARMEDFRKSAERDD